MNYVDEVNPTILPIMLTQQFTPKKNKQTNKQARHGTAPFPRLVSPPLFSSPQPSSFMSAPLSIPHNLTVQEIQVSIGRGVTHASLSVVVVYGIYDNLMVGTVVSRLRQTDTHTLCVHTHTHAHAHKLTHTQVPYTSDNATFCNRPWVNFFQQTGIQPAELWLPNTVKLS